MRLTFDEYSKHFKMSKEMISSRLRTNKLNYIVENGITYIIVTRSSDVKKEEAPKENKVSKAVVKVAQSKPRTTVATVLALYQRENKQLKEKILQLEAKVDKLIGDKEQMLRDEMNKIEQIYSTKDEQLKNVLELINTKLMLDQQSQTVHEIEALQNEEENKINENKTKNEIELVELREYLKKLDLKSHQRKIIKKRFFNVYDSDVRIIQQNGNLYLDFSKYDYSDLLAY